jgi:hypothetical protein
VAPAALSGEIPPTPTTSNDMLLLERLRGSQEFVALVYVAELTEPSGVVLIRAGHAYGLWRFENQAFHYMDPAYREPGRRAETVDAAVAATVQLLRSTNRAVADFVRSQRVVNAINVD